MINATRVFHCLIAVFTVCTAAAQDFQPASADGQERAAASSDSTEMMNAGRGGLFGIGGQKPLQRVKGIPLPNRNQRFAANTAAGPVNSSYDSVPFTAMRRSKPSAGELTTDFPARMIYLNGKNISSVREQQLEGVSVRIDASGNVHISAPHYEVQESSQYRPLLPNEVPRVSKPSASNEPPLFQGRYSKAAPQQRAFVPPVDPAEGQPEPEASASDSVKAASPAPAAPTAPAASVKPPAKAN
jgi:hypothetical protein